VSTTRQPEDDQHPAILRGDARCGPSALRHAPRGGSAYQWTVGLRMERNLYRSRDVHMGESQTDSVAAGAARVPRQTRPNTPSPELVVIDDKTAAESASMQAVAPHAGLAAGVKR
jgi:hypothetical protein